MSLRSRPVTTTHSPSGVRFPDNKGDVRGRHKSVRRRVHWLWNVFIIKAVICGILYVVFFLQPSGPVGIPLRRADQKPPRLSREQHVSVLQTVRAAWTKFEEVYGDPSAEPGDVRGDAPSWGWRRDRTRTDTAAGRILDAGGVTRFTGAGGGGGTPDGDLLHTARRIVHALSSSRPFTFAFGGYSTTVGRGNHFHQSYPFIMEGVIKGPFQMFGLDVVVRNAAIGGIPSFPYGFCLPNFYGVDDIDVISWEYGLNEGGGRQPKDAAGLEAYLRHSATSVGARNTANGENTFRIPPKFLLRDDPKANSRRKMIEHYVEARVLPDAVAIYPEKISKQYTTRTNEAEKPPGFRDWGKFGAPKGAPGQSPWHPGYREHELIGWMIAMHIMEALEVAADIMVGDVQVPSEWWNLNQSGAKSSQGGDLPEPVSLSRNQASSTHIDSLLYGEIRRDSPSSSAWKMNRVSCRTSFDPNFFGPLQDIVESGLLGEEKDMLSERDPKMYESMAGWVLDVGKLERDTKKKLVKFGGLGYIDMKKAFYGISTSGPLKLWLPLGGKNIEGGGSLRSMNADIVLDPKKNAKSEVETLVVCEVNEKRGDGECKLDKDISYLIGGVHATDVLYVEGTGLAYLGKQVCVHIGVPPSASLSKCKIKGQAEKWGLSVEFRVTNEKISVKSGACSVSHVVWEEN